MRVSVNVDESKFKGAEEIKFESMKFVTIKF